MTGPWLTLVGIGEDGVDGLSPAARRCVERAALVVGGARHLALVDGLGGGKRMTWPSPLTDAITRILEWRGRPVCVLASGDPFFYGVGATLAPHVPADEMQCLPAPSAFSLAAARLGWALQDCALLSLHGRAFERITPHLQPGARILALSWDGSTPGRLASFLAERGMGRSRFVVLEAMGGDRERINASIADDFAMPEVDPLNVVALEIVADRGALVLPLAAGLADALFENDGQITKRDIRAMTLSALAPRRGQLLWDVGAGSGSVGIEWMLRHPSLRTIAVETRPDRAARIHRNALALGVPELRIVEGKAPAVLEGLPAPDAVFVGGGATDPAVLDAAWSALADGGRLVVNAVTLETQAELMRRYAALGGDLTSIQIARADRVGPFHGFRPAMPVVQWAVTKGGAA
ncbi:cobalamin biosynthesis bifunctional protein CbiET [Alsobacter soli]|uniref:Cobalamin biosynthesis bifunctional protein CbiET n=1 Tax=Alsobacter soli TaxID=2109933 RepID=A0A2T1HYB8_9HYPH|nr:precorrin-6y C5,15-methyltransferase (decarboxylating) subunit CbiE [Alsobacter soli]PSC06686.1 cobalamin biosynthesis bifunctional protein CbiET [Alsobacter soli]